MKKLPSSSIALCTYNGQEHIEGQLKSLLEQSHNIDEIVICDDKSDDNTINIIQQIRFPQGTDVKVFVNKKQIGVNKNFEKAI